MAETGSITLIIISVVVGVVGELIVQAMLTAGNFSGTVSTLLNLVPIILAAVILFIGVRGLMWIRPFKLMKVTWAVHSCPLLLLFFVKRFINTILLYLFMIWYLFLIMLLLAIGCYYYGNDRNLPILILISGLFFIFIAISLFMSGLDIPTGWVVGAIVWNLIICILLF